MPSTSVSAGCALRYTTGLILMLAWFCSSSTPNWPVVPMAGDASANFSGSAFASLRKSCTLRAGTSGCTANTCGEEIACTMGAKLVRASNGRLLKSVWLIDRPSAATKRV